MIGEAEDRIISAIQQCPLGAKLREVASLPRITADVVRRIATQAPAVYTVAQETTVDGARAQIEFDVLCLARHARGHDGAARGDSTTVGLYEMLDSLMALTGPSARHGITARAARLARTSEFEELGLYAAVLHVRLAECVPAQVDAAALDDFVTFDAQYDLDPGQSGEPVAGDNVTLPQDP